MDELFFSIADAWNNDFSGIFGSSLSNEMIENSVSNASAFFDIDLPASIEPGISTGVVLGDTSIYYDDTQFFNRLQLEQMGITGQDGLDLVMTHEGTHRALQVLETGFDSYQEELCCDYMAGVRAGLNGMDVSQLENALIDLPQDIDHPIGEFRVKAIQEGIEFAQNYIETHETPPTFSECLDDFRSDNQLHDLAELSRIKNEMYSNECCVDHYQRILEEDPDNEMAQHKLSLYEHKYLCSNFELEHHLSFMGSSREGSADAISFKNSVGAAGVVNRNDGETTGSPGKDNDNPADLVENKSELFSETINAISFQANDEGETLGDYAKDDGETTGGVAKDDGDPSGVEKKFSNNPSFKENDEGETLGSVAINSGETTGGVARNDGETTGSAGKDSEGTKNYTHNHNDPKPSFGKDEKKYSSYTQTMINHHTKAANDAFDEEKRHYERAEKASKRGDEQSAKNHIQLAKLWHEDGEKHLRSIKAWKG